jgi:hypothetical protein
VVSDWEQAQTQALFELREELYKLKYGSEPTAQQTSVSPAIARHRL